ncbi:MAG: bifunctional diguanylate cyclase/phosphodiesterase [Lachnospiraceae bacterium]|nr:bifunctional diguanylate cyclase/phosphodiesterase [Lachnospiraceae bacterium]
MSNYSEYNIKEMQQFLKMTGGLYDIVRLVDPIECREISVNDGQLHYLEGCYNVWSSDQRCRKCSSYKACLSHHRNEKQEYFEGRVFHILSNPVDLINHDGSRISCVVEFITSHEASEQEQLQVNDRAGEVYESALLVDQLTGLLNGEGFYQSTRRLIKTCQEKGETCLVIAIDIVQFKLVNSLFGREKGNEVLIHIADMLRPYDSEHGIAGRLQGDRFGLCIPKSAFIEESLLVELEAVQHLLDEGTFRLIATAGIYEATDPEIPVSTMYDRALMALVQNRETKKTLISWFDQAMLDDLVRQQAISSGFERMMDSGQYRIFLQPQVDPSGRVLGAEALARLVRPDGTIVPPIQFIPVLEKSGLIAKLDRHVWTLAANQLVAWQGTPFSDLHISVNISALDFYFIDVYHTLVSLVESTGIDRRKLKLEITESAVMSDVEKQIKRVRDLRAYGFTVEIDDFGAGYSSLAMLKDIEADVLKIDMAFLRETRHIDRSQQVLRSIIDMAKSLDMQTITEVVETREQVDMLKEMGCNMFQGFYFAKPMPVSEFEEFAAGHLK